MKYGTLMAAGLATLFLVSCGKKEYYDAIAKRDELVIQYTADQKEDIEKNETQEMVHYSEAMTNAAKTPSQTDDVVIAFAWGYQSAQRQEIVIPNLQPIEAPSDGVDYLNAGLPYFYFLSPFLNAWAGDGNNTKNNITADGGSTIYLDSGNSGSYNQTGGNATINADIDNATEETPDQYGSCEDGGIWYTPGCSCETHAAGKC